MLKLRGEMSSDRASHRIPTIHDVARAAGVATSTVSRALRGEPRVNATTRARIQRVADELGYSPSRSALALRSINARTIGLVATNMGSPIAIDHLRATVRAAFDRGYTVLVADAQDRAAIQDAELGRMLEYRVDGLILGRGNFTVTPNLLRIVAAGIPIEPELSLEQLEGDLGKEITGYAERLELDASPALLAYRQLIQLGHRRFAMFLRESGAFSRSRRVSLEAELARVDGSGAKVTTIGIVNPEDCIGEVQALAASPEPPTVIISAQGVQTPYILEGMQRAGLQIPRDVSFLAFGDSAWHKAYLPPLSVVRHDYAAAATRSLARLVARIEGTDVPDVPRQPSEFILRGSFGPAKQEPVPGRVSSVQM
jgi:LacI family transcriptional regulator